MNETEKLLQQEISALKRQQDFFLEQLTKLCDLVAKLTETLHVETKNEIIRCQQKIIKQKK